MRTVNQISKIKNTFDEPKSIINFLSQEDIDHLVNVYDNSRNTQDPYQGKIKKNTGPVTLDISMYLEDPVITKIVNSLKQHIGEFEITAGFWFKTDYPHIIHNDDTFELPDNVYKAITIPLKLYGNNIINHPKLCFFDQYYFHGPSKFFKGETFVPTYYNKQIYEYNDVDNLTQNPINDSTYQKYFTHLKKSWLEGLSFSKAEPWIPGNAIVFDSVRLHCASDFRKQNVVAKLGISIFTKKTQ